MVEIKNSIDEPILSFCKVFCQQEGKPGYGSPGLHKLNAQKKKLSSQIQPQCLDFFLDRARCSLNYKLPDHLCCDSKLFHRAMKM